MATENKGASMDVVVKLILVFFISILSFSIGTFVGKKFSDNQHKISQLEPKSATDREIASVNNVPAASNEEKPKEALNDEEIKKLAEEFVSDDENKHGGNTTSSETADHAATSSATHESTTQGEATSHATTSVAKDATHGETPSHAGIVSHEKTASKEKSIADNKESASIKHEISHETPASAVAHAPAHAPSKVAERVVAGHAPSKEQSKSEISRIPQSLPKELSSSAIGKYTVQVASYPTEEEAQKIASDLKEQGFSAFYVSAKIKDKKTKTEKTWYRVSVGLFNTQKEAESYKKDLLARSKVTSAIIQKVTE